MKASSKFEISLFAVCSLMYLVCIYWKINSCQRITENSTNVHINRNKTFTSIKLNETIIEKEFQTEANEIVRSPCVSLLCAGLSPRGMVCELLRGFLKCDGYLCSMSVTCNGEVLLWLWYHKQTLLAVAFTLTGSQWSVFKWVFMFADDGKHKITQAA